ncbi:MAG TPA: MFS transporter [Burkholderiales bacterium]
MGPATSRHATLGVIALTLALAYGIWYAYGVILVALLKEFGWSRSVLAGAFSVFTLVHGGANPLIGMLCARFRPMKVILVGGVGIALACFADSFISTPLELYLAFGVLTALAVAAAGWVPALVHVQREFHQRVGLPIGIISAGVGVGMTLVVPLTQLLIDGIGWRGAFRVLGLLCAVWIVPAALWVMHTTDRIRGQSPNLEIRGQTPEKQNQEDSGSVPNITLREAVRMQPFWLLVAAFFFGNINSQTLHVHQVAHLVDHGLAPIVAASVVGVVGFASIVGKTGGGWLSDRVERELVYVAGIVVLAASALLLLLLGDSPSRSGAYGYAVLLGIGYSVTAAITPAMMSDRFSGKHFGAIVGVGLMGSAVGSAFGPWMAGRIYDTAGSYTAAFLIAASCGAVAGVCAWRARALRRAALSCV